MFYYLYKITNWFTGKIYIGYHQTENLDDGYMGSGKHLKRSQKKYGIEYFTKDILEFFETEEQMINAEEQIVNEEFIKDPMTYNAILGGGKTKGWSHLTFEKRSSAGKKGMASLREKMKDENFKEKWKESLKLSFKEGRSKLQGCFAPGYKRSEKNKQKMSEANKNKCYVYLDNITKRISLDEINYYLDLGWKRGRHKSV